ncbi:Plant specific eukaryotic initiation factor 4B [Artemisia annua]|uniref:Plant specific eukaryotic initiation factor 4B n=1 Tax=Artemisia annua TaxID=35608 RepID=A0A2U1N8K9_ARTAN|nr:Plant specific eukaryotic initiation factor 4B [Artemisia annua]
MLPKSSMPLPGSLPPQLELLPRMPTANEDSLEDLGSGDRMKRGVRRPKSNEDSIEGSWRKNQSVEGDVVPSRFTVLATWVRPLASGCALVDTPFTE